MSCFLKRDFFHAPDELYPVICIDEKSKQLISDTRKPIKMKAGEALKLDYEYKRNGTRNLFVAVEPKAGNYYISVTMQRAKADFARFIEDLLKNKYKKAKKVRIVLDNLNTHFPQSFYETFSKAKAKALLSKIDFIYTPKHASWLNMAEIAAISMLEKECIDRRIGTEKELIEETNQWLLLVDKEKRKINWRYTKRDAYKKLSKHYVA